MAIGTVHVKVLGRVQGVFFRDYTLAHANKCGLVGWVRNMADGSVELELQGEEESIKAMTTWLHQGSPLSVVSKVMVTQGDSTMHFVDFEIRRS